MSEAISLTYTAAAYQAHEQNVMIAIGLVCVCLGAAGLIWWILSGGLDD